MLKSRKQVILLKQCAISILFAIVIFSLPTFCVTQSKVDPSFKYSREANENFDKNAFEKHEHNHDHVHIHMKTDHAHGSVHHEHVHHRHHETLKINRRGSTTFIQKHHLPVKYFSFLQIKVKFGYIL